MTFILHILRLVSRRLLRLIQLALSTAKTGILSLWPIVPFLSSLHYQRNIYSEDQDNSWSSGYDSVESRNPKPCGNKKEDVSVTCHSHLPSSASCTPPSHGPPSLIQEVHLTSSTSEKAETDKHITITSETKEKDELTIETTSPSNLCRYDRKIKV